MLHPGDKKGAAGKGGGGGVRGRKVQSSSKGYLQKLISKCDGHHGLHHGDCSGNHAGVMSAFGQQLDIQALPADRVLPASNGRCGLEGHAHHNVFTV